MCYDVNGRLILTALAIDNGAPDLELSDNRNVYTEDRTGSMSCLVPAVKRHSWVPRWQLSIHVTGYGPLEAKVWFVTRQSMTWFFSLRNCGAVPHSLVDFAVSSLWCPLWTYRASGAKIQYIGLYGSLRMITAPEADSHCEAAHIFYARKENVQRSRGLAQSVQALECLPGRVPGWAGSLGACF